MQRLLGRRPLRPRRDLPTPSRAVHGGMPADRRLGPGEDISRLRPPPAPRHELLSHRDRRGAPRARRQLPQPSRPPRQGVRACVRRRNRLRGERVSAPDGAGRVAFSVCLPDHGHRSHGAWRENAKPQHAQHERLLDAVGRWHVLARKRLQRSHHPDDRRVQGHQRRRPHAGRRLSVPKGAGPSERKSSDGRWRPLPFGRMQRHRQAELTGAFLFVRRNEARFRPGRPSGSVRKRTRPSRLVPRGMLPSLHESPERDRRQRRAASTLERR
mmetsp:Transcript_10483/g.39583  ORF Transcript_10483/g.39583 Transcript_10483/m.39583 type:complete len:270 (+) Transcript_10483:791-1600(+)